MHNSLQNAYHVTSSKPRLLRGGVWFNSRYEIRIAHSPSSNHSEVEGGVGTWAVQFNTSYSRKVSSGFVKSSLLSYFTLRHKRREREGGREGGEREGRREGREGGERCRVTRDANVMTVVTHVLQQSLFKPIQELCHIIILLKVGEVLRDPVQHYLHNLYIQQSRQWSCDLTMTYDLYPFSLVGQAHLPRLLQSVDEREGILQECSVGEQKVFVEGVVHRVLHKVEQ